MKVDISRLPYFKVAIAAYAAEIAALEGETVAREKGNHYKSVLMRAARERTWAFFASARDESLRDDVLAVLCELYRLIIEAGDSNVNGYHPVGYLWHFSRKFADMLADARSDSKLFLLPGEFGPDFAGTKPEVVGSEGCVTPGHLTSNLRAPVMSMMAQRGAVFCPFGKGGDSELRLHREFMQIARWFKTPFSQWPEAELPRRFLIDTKINSGWYFDSQAVALNAMVELGSLYDHDLADHRDQEVIIRVTGQRAHHDDVFPNVFEFESATEAAAFIFARGR